MIALGFIVLLAIAVIFIPIQGFEEWDKDKRK